MSLPIDDYRRSPNLGPALPPDERHELDDYKLPILVSTSNYVTALPADVRHGSALP